VHVLMFCEFGLEMPIHSSKIGIFRGSDPLNVDECQHDSQKAPACGKIHTTYKYSKSVSQFRHGHDPGRIK